MPATITRAEANLALSVEIHSGLLPVSQQEWQQLFANHPDPPALIDLVDRGGMEGFEFNSVVVRAGDKPLLVLPTMLARYPITTTLDGKEREIAEKIEKRLPHLLNPKVLIVGFVEGEWGQVGIDTSAPETILRHGWSLAARALKQLVKQKKADALGFWQFCQESLRALPPELTKDFAVIAGQPFSELPITFASLNEYLATVDSDMRRYLNRAQRKKEKLRIVRTREVKHFADRIYQLYKTHVGGSQMSFGEQSATYFRDVCANVPGAEYVLYMEQDWLIGFELLVRHQDKLVSKYFGMEPQAGRDYKLYFVSWLENISYCIAHQIPHFHVGASGEDLKVKLGAKLIPTAVLVKAGNPIVHFIIKKLQDELAYESTVEIPRLRLP